MEADDGLQVTALAAELECGRAAEAVADGGEPGGIDLLLRLEHLERRRGTGHNAGRVGDPGGNLRPDLGKVGMRLAFAVIVHGEGGVAEASQPRGDLPGVLRKARSFVEDQPSGAAGARAVVDPILADHADTVGTVFDVLSAHVLVYSIPGFRH